MVMKNLKIILLIIPLWSFAQWQQIGDPIVGLSTNDQAGRSVSMNANGDIVAIGTPFSDENGGSAGSVRVFENQSGNWVQLGNTIFGENSLDEFGTSVALNDDGTILVVGSPESNTNGFEAGVVTVYEFQANSWVQKGSVLQGQNPSDHAGFSVSINGEGNRIAFGEPEFGTNNGRVRIYEFQTDDWQSIGVIVGTQDDRYGYSVSFNQAGDVLSLGAIFYDTIPSNTIPGAVGVYQYNGGSTWNLMGNLITGEFSGDRAGTSVSLSDSGMHVAIGATHHNPGGQVRVFEFVTDSWQQLGNSLGSTALNNRLGQSVSLNGSGNILAVSDHRYSGVFPDGGYIQVYELDAANWLQIDGNINAQQPTQWFGYSVSLNQSGNTIAIGAPVDTSVGADNNRGHVQVFDNNTTLSVEDVIGDSKIVAYPNPIDDVLHLKLTDNKPFLDVQITDVNGRVVYNNSFSSIKNQTTLSMPMSQLESGIYILEINQGYKTSVIKVIKN